MAPPILLQSNDRTSPQMRCLWNKWRATSGNGWGLLPFVNPPEGFLVRVGKWEPLIIKNKPQTSAYVARKLSV